ncbi:hypothetical protein [Tychonema sp. LEGE 07203]|uniref:hypothetical protein n=1 Tax=Tychonema sp. LEGE 07203 TaxID=1828671 RepID=UPI0018829FF9|nr:hypothetical protein [Tychonema sp. LEGE 07203]MBE9093108.1 hypothetical protein [Tychonema sp. LEGE 07203]
MHQPPIAQKLSIIALSTSPINRSQAVETIKAACAIIGKNDRRYEYPVYLLKMTCPSTGCIHALRVPPDVQLAKEAIRWVNWDMDPEKFSVQT